MIISSGFISSMINHKCPFEISIAYNENTFVKLDITKKLQILHDKKFGALERKKKNFYILEN